MPLSPDELAAQAADHNCQTPDCDNLYDLVIFRTRDGEANWLCWVCAVPFLAGVVEGITTEAAAAIDAAGPPDGSTPVTAILGDNGQDTGRTLIGDEEIEAPEDILARYGAGPGILAPGA